ncbi:hypothetical protein CYD30_27745 [Kosakonia cowanii]|nr:hypothetical protein CYD30_27745 [Kosakonia cowanii]
MTGDNHRREVKAVGKESAGEVKRQPVQPGKSKLEILETLTNEEIQKAREAAERIAASFGFYVRKPGISPEERLAPTEEKSYE